MNTELEAASKELHAALDVMIKSAIEHGRDQIKAEIENKLHGLLGDGVTESAKTAVAEPETKKPRRKFRKTKAWREAVARNLAKGRGAKKAKQAVKRKRRK